jgi:hypothetical protein
MQRGESLVVAAAWVTDSSVRAGRAAAGDGPEFVEVEIALGEAKGARRPVSAGAHADTAYFPLPAAGGTLSGRTCVHTAGEAVCTPWQFVRPRADPVTAGGAGPNRIRVIVVRPEGLQVDPDVGGRCAAWQQQHPGAPLWQRVNERAVPECMGPNDKPTVAQFCAFAVLADGRRIKTANSAGDPYCDRLFERWISERVS